MLVAALALVCLRAGPASAQDVPCPKLEGWTRLLASQQEKPVGQNDLPWNADRPLNNAISLDRLWAMAAGWEASGTLYVGGDYGMYRSGNGGASWDWIGSPWTSVSSDPRPRGIILRLATAPGGRWGHVKRMEQR